MSSKYVKLLLKRPYFAFAFLSVFVFLGINGYFSLDKNLFPNSNRPEIALVAVMPSASANTLVDEVVIPLEEEFYTIDGVRRVYSSTLDEVATIRVEFHYRKSLEEAASDVKNRFDKLRSVLPKTLKEPQIHKITEATAPIMTIGVHGKNIDLATVRELSQDRFKPQLLQVKGVSNVDIFGGHTKALMITLDKKKLERYGLSINSIKDRILSVNSDYALGVVESNEVRYLVKSQGRANAIFELEQLPITEVLVLKDIATISINTPSNQALYQGNGKDAIALSVQRALDADVVRTVERVEKQLEELRVQYPELVFDITDTQKTTIVQSTDNMFEALRDAIIMSSIVVFLFLASFRQIIVVLLTIPVVYVSTISLMWFFGLEFNVITLTAIVLALGLLLDDTVVVVENIDRYYQNSDLSLNEAVEKGTSEILFADFSGTVTTMVAIFPILFVGDYPQTVFGPLISTLLLALASSFVISITFVPLISTKVLGWKIGWFVHIERYVEHFTGRFNKGLSNFFLHAFELARQSKSIALAYIVILLLLVGVSVRIVMPLVGQELLPAMDAGAVSIKITTDPNLSIEQTKVILGEVTNHAKKASTFISSTASIGSEAGVLSIGGGSIGQINMIVNYINRFERDEDIWEIGRHLREVIAKIPNISSVEVAESGATGMASIKATLTTTLMGDDLKELYALAGQYEAAMRETRGIVNVSKSWKPHTQTYEINYDKEALRHVGISEKELSSQLQLALQGTIVGSFEKQNHSALPLRLELGDSATSSIGELQSLYIQTPKGNIPFSALASTSLTDKPNVITREGMYYTIDIMGVREKEAPSLLTKFYEENIKRIELPFGVERKDNGDMAQFKDSSIRIVKAVGIGVVLIFIVMVPMFNSIKIPLLIIFSIPLTIAGASWVLLLLNYHSSMSAMIGFILLAGLIVNNAILLIHFALEEMREGKDAIQAMRKSILVRTRPVLMTAASVSAGMIPVMLGWAIGLERLAPLGAVVVGGLAIGTLLTLVFIPLFFIWIHPKSS
ncbi:MAG: efflux RND transporter permease subunit [Campylobacteraceae bacterium]|nr:efflux RND transporter permease subunit [Campylobacteraceae bacterium]